MSTSKDQDQIIENSNGETNQKKSYKCRKLTSLDKQFFIILIMIISSMSCFILTFAIYPLEAKNKKKIDRLMIIIILCVNAIGGSLSSLLLGKFVFAISKKKILIALQLLQSFSFIGFGFLQYIDDQLTFIILSIVSRIILGISQSGIASILYSYIPLLFPLDIQNKNCWCDFTWSIGQIIFLQAGQYLYQNYGFMLPFVIFGSQQLILSLILLKFLPDFSKSSEQYLRRSDQGQYNKIDLSWDSWDIISDKLDQVPTKSSLTYSQVFKSCKVFFTNMIFIGRFIINYFIIQTIALQIRVTLIAQYNFNENQDPKNQDYINFENEVTYHVSNYFTIDQTCYLVTLIFLNYAIPKSVNRKIIILFGVILQIVSLLFIGQIKIIPNHINYMYIGVTLLAMSKGISFLLMPQLISLAKEVYPKNASYEQIVDICVAIGVFDNQFSQIIQPIYGGLLNNYAGYSMTLFVFMCMQTTFLILNIISHITEKDKKKSILKPEESGIMELSFSV